MRISPVIAVCAMLAACTSHKPNTITLKVTPPVSANLQPAQGRVVSSILVDLPATTANAGTSAPQPR